MNAVSPVDITVGTIVADSEAIELWDDLVGGEIYVPAGSTITTITWWACATKDGTYLPAYDSAAAAVTQTVAASRACQIPTSLAGARFLKAVGNAGGTITVSLK